MGSLSRRDHSEFLLLTCIPHPLEYARERSSPPPMNEYERTREALDDIA